MAPPAKPTKFQRLRSYGGFDKGRDIGAFRKSHHHSHWDTSEFDQPAEANQGI
jgi:hypothetical protein